MVLSAAFAFVLNLLYTFYHGVLGILNLSLWFLALCAFYGILAAVRLSAVLCAYRNRAAPSADTEYFVMALSGILLAVLSFVLMAVVAISLSRNTAVRHPEIMMITIAAYTFSKLTIAIVQSVRQRRDTAPLPAVIRGIRRAEVAASILTLQRSMLVSFGAPSGQRTYCMNLLTGAAVCLFVLVFGVSMAVRGIKKGT